jgi:hypothetical protein
MTLRSPSWSGKSATRSPAARSEAAVRTIEGTSPNRKASMTIPSNAAVARFILRKIGCTFHQRGQTTFSMTLDKRHFRIAFYPFFRRHRNCYGLPAENSADSSCVSEFLKKRTDPGDSRRYLPPSRLVHSQLFKESVAKYDICMNFVVHPCTRTWVNCIVHVAQAGIHPRFYISE